jgi:glycosyl transferase family 25
MLKSFDDIEHVLYINLESRSDRNEYVIAQLSNINIMNANRFNAIKLPNNNGAIGCSMSHLKCLELAKKNEWPHVFICEDDITFTDPTLLTQQINTFLSKKRYWDVLILGGNNMLPYKSVDDNCIQVLHCLTTTGYIVQHHYYDILIQNIKEGLGNLIRNPENKKEFAIDKYWIQLQMKDCWFMLIPPSVIQREDYSDIEGRVTNFQQYMLNYNKCYK